MSRPSEWTPVQERVMDLVYGSGTGFHPWRGPCGHSGTQMTISPEGVVTCHHTLSSRHDHTHWTPDMWMTWRSSNRYCVLPHCEEIKCGRTYTETDVRGLADPQATTGCPPGGQ